VDPVAAENPPSTGDFLERNMGKPSNKKKCMLPDFRKVKRTKHGQTYIQ